MAVSNLDSQNEGGHRWFPIFLRLPLIGWQTVFFFGPLLFMLAMSFFVVRNYRMQEAFEFSSWERMLTRGAFWDAYWFTLTLAVAATILVSAIAFPAAYTLAFKVGATARRWALFLLVVPFFTSYIVRMFSWYVVLAEAGRMGLDLPVTKLVDGFYAEVQAMGGARWDTSSLLRRLQRRRD